jgi:flagellar hook-basal body complex protein FliE
MPIFEIRFVGSLGSEDKNMSQVAFKTNFSSDALDQIAQQRKSLTLKNDVVPGNSEGGKLPSFLDHLKQGIADVNQGSKVADRLTGEVATGKDDNIHEAMLAMTQTELSFNFLVQVRNKALEAYQEVMRMPV